MITALDPRTALVLIDLQKGILNYPLQKPSSELLERAGKLLAAFRKSGLPVVFVTVHPPQPNPAIRRDSAARAVSTDPVLYEVAPELEVLPEDIRIVKPGWNAFFGTPLHEELQRRGITGIVLAGVATSIGVEGTARSAAELGYNLTFIRDGMTDWTVAAHEHSLNVIFPRIGEVGDSGEVIELLRD